MCQVEDFCFTCPRMSARPPIVVAARGIMDCSGVKLERGIPILSRALRQRRLPRCGEGLSGCGAVAPSLIRKSTAVLCARLAVTKYICEYQWFAHTVH